MHGNIWKREWSPDAYGHGKGAEHIWAPEWCLGKYQNWKGARVHYSTGMLPEYICVPKRCPDTFTHRNGAWEYIGNELVPGKYRTGRVHRNIWKREVYKQIYRHSEGTQAHIGTRMVQWHIWAPEWCTGTYGHRIGAHAHIGTKRVPGHILAPVGCPGSYGHQKGAQTHIGIRWVPRHNEKFVLSQDRMTPMESFYSRTE